MLLPPLVYVFFFFQAEDGIRDLTVTGVQTCALPIFELIDVPQSRYSGKNSADIRMVVDALDLAYGKTHIDSFALVSGDSDFSPLVSKLRENEIGRAHV